MQTKKLYHRDIFLPDRILNLSLTSCQFGHISDHAQKAANSDRFGRIKIPESVQFCGKDIIELETFEDSSNLKFVVRIPYNFNYELIVVILFADDYNIVKTVWLNDKFDRHTTLDKSKYFNPLTV